MKNYYYTMQPVYNYLPSSVSNNSEIHGYNYVEYPSIAHALHARNGWAADVTINLAAAGGLEKGGGYFLCGQATHIF